MTKDSNDHPTEFVEYFRNCYKEGVTDHLLTIVHTLHEDCNHSLLEIAEYLNLSKTTISKWMKKPYTPEEVNITFPPSKPEPYILSEMEKQNLANLAKLASKVSRNTPQDAPSRRAAKQLIISIEGYLEKNTPITHIAKAANVSRRSIYQRLDTYAKNYK